MNKKLYLITILLGMLIFPGCGKEISNDDINIPSVDNELSGDTNNAHFLEKDTSLRFNTDYVTSNPFMVEAGTELSSELSDWIISDSYENIEVSIRKADTDRILTKLPSCYYPTSSPYKITFLDTVTKETLSVEVHAIAGLEPENYDVTTDPLYSPLGDEEIIFDPELYNENENYFFCTNLSVLTDREDFLPTLAIADFSNQVGQFILPIADAGNWDKPESCYILESTIEQTETYSRFNIYINPNQNLEIQVTYYNNSGYEFIIVHT